MLFGCSFQRMAESELKMATLCQKCGVSGFPELLVCCRKCKTSAEHRYCLDKFPKRNENVRWLCEECKPKFRKLVSFENIAFTKDEANYQDPQPICSKCAPGSRNQHPHIPSPAKAVSTQNSQIGITDGPRRHLDECGNSPHSSPEQRKDVKSKRQRRFIEVNNRQLDQALQSDCVDQNINKETMKLPNEPVVITLQPERTLMLPSASTSQTAACDEVMDRSQVVSVETFGLRSMVPVEAHDAQLSVHCNQSFTNQLLDSHAQPILYHEWRGCFFVGGEEYGPIMAHASNKACEKVFNTARLLPSVLHMEKLPRLDAWPNSFRKAPPVDSNIALYFFPETARAGVVLDKLLDDINDKDLVLKFLFDEVELLVFSSVRLPEDHHRFLGKYYLWGVFRRRQSPVPNLTANCPSGELTEYNQKVKNQALVSASPANCPSDELREENRRIKSRASVPHLPFNSSSEPTEDNWRMEVADHEVGRKDLECQKESSADVTQNDNNVTCDSDELSEEIKRSKSSCKHADDRREVELKDDGANDNDAVLPHSSGGLTSKLNNLTEEIQEIEEVGAPKVHCSGSSLKSQTSVPCISSVSPAVRDFTEKKHGLEKVLDCTGEREGVERYDDDSSSPQKCDLDLDCLELFPLQGEDMAIVTRVGWTSDVDLNLGLNRRSVGDSEDLYLDKIETRSKVFWDSVV